MQNKDWPTLLIVDDNPKNLYATKHLLADLPIKIDMVMSGNDALKALLSTEYFLILMDVEMPDMNGFETVSLCRSDAKNVHIPVIFLTAMMTGRNSMVAGYNEGAVDYLIKPIEPMILLSKVQTFLDLKMARRELEVLASSDVLTGLANRNMFHTFEQRALNLAKRNQSFFAVLFLDLDHFKTINDTLGHDVGDLLLQAVAKTISNSLRESDMVARMGGDEFAILLTDISQPQDAGKVANDVLQALKKPIILNGKEIHCGASIGISCYPSCGDSCQLLEKAADIALYKAKEKRNSFQFYSHEIQQQMLIQLSLQQSLKTAIAEEEFEVYYQAKVDAKSKKTIGWEALLRWNHATLGWITPTQFISLAEESGQIVTLGAWVLKAVVAQCSQWDLAAAAEFKMTIAINVSPKQLADSEFLQEVKDILKQSTIRPELIELELTENALMEDPEAAIETLKAISALGVKIAIDDFGTGYSSLSYLQRLPIDTVKIDLSFIQALSNSQQDKTIVEAIIDLAHTLGIQVVAEGVETEEQATFLTQARCDYLQGFYYAKPLPANELSLCF